MSLVCDLPKYIALEFLKAWLKLNEICKFDSSLCDSSLRDKFLNLFTSSDVVLTGLEQSKVPIGVVWNMCCIVKFGHTQEGAKLPSACSFVLHVVET